jgi:tellurite resistance protein
MDRIVARREVAREAWERFGAVVPDEVQRAIAGAFAAVVCADGQLDEAELERFAQLLRDDATFPGVDPDRAAAAFGDLARAILADYADGYARALDAVTLAAVVPGAPEAIVRAAQVAVVADQRLAASEEAVLGRICRALGLNPRDY